MAINVKKWIPIICPQKEYKYIDRFGQPNAYVEMNPSLFIDADGTFRLLVRMVNYKKYYDKSFSMSQHKSISQYHIFHGNVQESSGNYTLKFNTSEKLNIDFNGFRKYESYWLGVEDIRFINKSNVLAVVPEANCSGYPCIFSCEIHNEKERERETITLMLLSALLPNINVEKNWMPYSYNNEDYVIYSLYPFCIKKINESHLIYTGIKNDNLNDYLNDYHGSTNGIPYSFDSEKESSKMLLFIIHATDKLSGKTIHRWLLFNPKDYSYKVSNTFIFNEYSYIEFPCSLSTYDGQLYIGLGVDDNKAYIVIADFPNADIFK